MINVYLVIYGDLKIDWKLQKVKEKIYFLIVPIVSGLIKK